MRLRWVPCQLPAEVEKRPAAWPWLHRGPPPESGWCPASRLQQVRGFRNQYSRGSSGVGVPFVGGIRRVNSPAPASSMPAKPVGDIDALPDGHRHGCHVAMFTRVETTAAPRRSARLPPLKRRGRPLEFGEGHGDIDEWHAVFREEHHQNTVPLVLLVRGPAPRCLGLRGRHWTWKDALHFPGQGQRRR